MIAVFHPPFQPVSRPSSRLRRAASGLALIAALCIAGCSRELDVPRPLSGTPTPPPPLEPSVVLVPVTMNMGALFAEVERTVPRTRRASGAWTVVDDNPVGEVGVKYEVWRDPLQLAFQGATLTASAKVYYWMEVAQKIPKPFVGGAFWQSLASCGRGEPPRRAVAGLRTSFTWRPDWRLTSTTSLLPISFLNRCEVTLLNIDVTDRVKDAFETGLRQGAAIADDRMRGLGDFRRYGELAWRQLLEPVRLDDDLWLMMEPSSAYVSSLNGSGDRVTATIGLTALPRVVYGPRPAPSMRPLPKLETRGTGEGLHVMVEGDLPFADANRELVNAIVGRTFTVTGHDVNVVSASLWGAGDQVVVQLGLTGDVRGTIYFVGSPAYDPASNMLYLRDLDYSLETRTALATIADWMNHEGFRQSIAGQARFPLSDHISEVKARLDAAMNQTYGANIAAHGRVSAIRPVGVYLTATGFKARVAIDGSLSLEIR